MWRSFPTSLFLFIVSFILLSFSFFCFHLSFSFSFFFFFFLFSLIPISFFCFFKNPYIQPQLKISRAKRVKFENYGSYSRNFMKINAFVRKLFSTRWLPFCFLFILFSKNLISHRISLRSRNSNWESVLRFLIFGTIPKIPPYLYIQ